MVLEELLKEERAEGKAEGKAEDVLELLEEKGPVSETIMSKILAERDLERLKFLHKAAAQAETLADFLKRADLESK